MAKIHKLTLFIVDANDVYDDIEYIISDSQLSTDLSFTPYDSKSVSFEWEDELEINYSDCAREEYEKYFK
jgi:hypothetical protein